MAISKDIVREIVFENYGKIVVGDVLSELKKLGDETVQCVVTSPPYWGLRDYGYSEQIGAESELEDYIEKIGIVFKEVYRVLSSEGTLWLNIGDSYTSGNRKWRDSDKKNPARAMSYRPGTPKGLKPKDLIGVPWRIAFELQKFGWYLRSDIVWYKPNCQPESVKDRPTQSHEYIFLFSKNEKYYYDHESVMLKSFDGKTKKNLRSVWSINTESFKDAHFAVFPTKLVIPCVLAGSKPGTTVLDPFLGSGTTAEVCVKLGRKFFGIELNEDYAEIAKKRIKSITSDVALELYAPQYLSIGNSHIA